MENKSQGYKSQLEVTKYKSFSIGKGFYLEKTKKVEKVEEEKGIKELSLF